MFSTILLWVLQSRGSWWITIGLIAQTVPVVVVGLVRPRSNPSKGYVALLPVVSGVVLIIAGLLFTWFSVRGLIVAALLFGYVAATFIPLSQAEMMQSVSSPSAASNTFEFFSRTGSLLGPLLAGWLLKVVPVSLATMISGLSLVGTGLSMFVARSALSPTTIHYSRNFSRGVRHILDNRWLRNALGIRTVTNLVWPALNLTIPLVAAHKWHAGAFGYGLALTVYGVANVVATLILGRRWADRAEQLYFAAWMVSGIGFMGVAWSPGLAAGFGAVFLSGLTGPVAHIALDTHIGRTVPRGDQTRVYALQRLVLSGVSLAGLLVMSVLVLRISADSLACIAGGIIFSAGLVSTMGQVREGLRKSRDSA